MPFKSVGDYLHDEDQAIIARQYIPPKDGSDIMRGFSAGVDELQGLGGLAMAATGQATGSDTLKKAGLEIYKNNEDEAAKSAPRVGSLEDIHSVGDAMDWAQYTLGSLAPMAAQSIATAIIGGVAGEAVDPAGGGIPGAVAGAVARKGVTKLLLEYAKGGIKGELEEGAAKRLLTEIGGKRIGAGAATALNSYGIGVGDTYGETIDAGKPDAGKAFLGAVPYSMADMFGDIAILKKAGLLDDVVTSAEKKTLKSVGMDLAITGAKEGAGEAAQEGVLIGTHKSLDPNYDPTGQETRSRLLNSFVAGYLGGVAGEGLAEGANSLQQKAVNKVTQSAEANVTAGVTVNQDPKAYTQFREALQQSTPTVQESVLSALDGQLTSDKIASLNETDAKVLGEMLSQAKTISDPKTQEILDSNVKNIMGETTTPVVQSGESEVLNVPQETSQTKGSTEPSIVQDVNSSASDVTKQVLKANGKTEEQVMGEIETMSPEQLEKNISQIREKTRRDMGLMVTNQEKGVTRRVVTDANGNVEFVSNDFSLAKAKAQSREQAAEYKKYTHELLYENDPIYQAMVDRQDNLKEAQGMAAGSQEEVDQIINSLFEEGKQLNRNANNYEAGIQQEGATEGESSQEEASQKQATPQQDQTNNSKTRSKKTNTSEKSGKTISTNPSSTDAGRTTSRSKQTASDRKTSSTKRTSKTKASGDNEKSTSVKAKEKFTAKIQGERTMAQIKHEQARAEQFDRGHQVIKQKLKDEFVRGGMEKEHYDTINHFVDRMEKTLKDVGLNFFEEGDAQGEFSFEKKVTNIFRKNTIRKSGYDRVVLHELWHSISRYIPKEEMSALNKHYLNEKAVYLQENPEFAQALRDAKSQEEIDNAFKTQGMDAYKYYNVDEYFAEVMTAKSIAEIEADKNFKDLSMFQKAVRIFKEILHNMIRSVQESAGYDAAEKLFRNMWNSKALKMTNEFGIGFELLPHDQQEALLREANIQRTLKMIDDAKKSRMENKGFEKILNLYNEQYKKMTGMDMPESLAETLSDRYIQALMKVNGQKEYMEGKKVARAKVMAMQKKLRDILRSRVKYKAEKGLRETKVRMKEEKDIAVYSAKERMQEKIDAKNQAAAQKKEFQKTAIEYINSMLPSEERGKKHLIESVMAVKGEKELNKIFQKVWDMRETYEKRVARELEQDIKRREKTAAYAQELRDRLTTYREKVTSWEDRRLTLRKYARAMLPVGANVKQFLGAIGKAKTDAHVTAILEKIDAERKSYEKTQIQKKIKRLLKWNANAQKYAPNRKYPIKIRQEIARIAAGYKDASLPELIDMHNQITQYRQLGKQLMEARQAIEKMTLDNRIQMVQEGAKNLDQIDPKQMLNPTAKRDITFWQKFKDKTSTGLINFLTPDRFFDMLDGNKHYTGETYKMFKETLDIKRNEAENLFDNIITPFWAMVNSKELTGVPADKFLPNILKDKWNGTPKENEMSNAERIMIYAHRNQKGGMEKLLKGTGYTEEQINSVNLTQDEMDMYQFMRQKLDELHPVIAAEYYRVYNEELPYIENYFPFMSNMSGNAGLNGFHDMMLQDFRRRSVHFGSTETRLDYADEQNLEMDAFKVFEEYTKRGVYWTHLNGTLLELNRVIADQRFVDKVGLKAQRYIMEYLDTLARLGITKDAARHPILDRIRENITIYTLGFRPTSQLIQYVALLNGSAEIGQYAFKGINLIMQPEWEEFARKNSSELRNRTGRDVAFQDAKEQGGLSKTKEASMALTKYGDQKTAGAVWTGAYLKSMEEQGLEVDFSTPNQQALNYANLVTRITQGGTDYKDLPQILRGKNKSLMKIAFMFQTFTISSISNYMIHDMGSYFKTQSRAKSAQQVAFLTAAFLAEAGLRSAVGMIAASLTGDDEEKKKRENENIAMSALFNALGSIPLAGQFINGIQYGTNPVPMIDFSQKYLTSLNQSLFAKESDTQNKHILRMIAYNAGIYFGLPLDYVEKMIEDTFFSK